MVHAQLGRFAPRDRGVVSGIIWLFEKLNREFAVFVVIARSEATKQSILFFFVALWIASLRSQ
jgi:hypothetical protein